KRIASSFKDFSKSNNSSKLISSMYPRPEHVSHIPFGLLKEKISEYPTNGVPIRDHNKRTEAYISEIVPTVEREFPPNLFLLIIIANGKCFFMSTFIFLY